MAVTVVNRVHEGCLDFYHPLQYCYNTKYLFTHPDLLPDVFYAAELRFILATTHTRMTPAENYHSPYAYLLLRALFLGLASFLFGRHGHGDNLLSIFLSRLLN